MVATRSKATLSKDAAKGKTFGLVVSRYHEELTQKMLDGALDTLKEHGAKADDCHVVWVPGSFEIPLAARALVSQELDAVICLGIIVKGETPHDEYIAREAARGISAVAQGSGTPVSFGVLTTLTEAQAKARCGGDKGNKGAEAAESAIHMIDVLAKIKKLGNRPVKSVGFGF